MLKRQGFIFFPKKGNTFRFLLLILQFVILRTEMKTEPTTYNLLNSISDPEDLRKLSVDQLPEICKELRQDIIKEVSCNPGHFAASLGTVELTVALHYVFNSPEDKIVFDVSHQSYPHKMLTGRKDAYLYPEKYDDVSGYSEPSESAHDHFVIGHTSTSVSLAGGLAKGRDLKGEKGNVIAVIGDGSLSGGEAF